MEPTQPNAPSDLEISFRPVTEGLGFHPFSDGLPYAPVVKSPRINPSLPVVQNLRAQANLSHPPAPGMMPAGSGSVRVSSPGIVSGPLIHPQTAFNFQKLGLEPKPIVLTQNLSFGGFYLLKRVLAYTFDFAINSVLILGILFPWVLRQEFNLDIFSNASIFILLILLASMANWTFISLQEVILGTSIGKRIFGLVLKGSGTQRFLRALFFVPSAGFFGLGLFFMIFDPKKQGWHDRLVNLQPIELMQN